MGGPVAVALLLLAAVLANPQPPVHAQFTSNSLTVTVFNDGTAAVNQSISVNGSDTSVAVPLLSAVLSSPLALDQNGSSLYFQISGSNITVYTVGATSVLILYDTLALTSKQGAVWTVSYASAYNTTLILPQAATVSSVSGTPVSLADRGGSPVLILGPGSWTVSYGVPVRVSTTSTSSGSGTTATSATSSTSATSGGGGLGPAYEVGGLAALLAVVIAVLLWRRRKALPGGDLTELRPDDVKVLKFIASKGGKVLEPEIRMNFALPKTSAWRQIKRLERMGYVKVTKIGSQNQIELVREKAGPEGPL
jgi:uncharacterized membrane protein